MAATYTTWTRGAVTTLFMVMASWMGQAQSTMPKMISNRVVKDADKEMSLSRFAEAHDLYRAVAMSDYVRAQKDTSFAPRLDVFAKGIDCAMRAGLVHGATELLDSLISADVASSDQWMMRLELAMHQGDDAKAQSLVSAGKSAVKDPAWNASADALVKRAAEARKTETRAEINRARPSSDMPEFGAVPYKDGLMFVTTSVADGFAAPVDGWTGRQYSELRQVALKDSADNPVSFNEMANKDDLSDLGSAAFHNGPVSFSADETRAFVTRSQDRALRDTSGRWIYALKLEVMDLDESGSWKTVEGAFPYNDSTFSSAHSALDTLGNLIFSSDRPGGLGGMDLWMCKKGANGFEAPMNLGAAVNTSGNDVFPYVNSVNQLYFSTDGRVGFGGLDLYKHDMESGSTELLGAPVNSFADDFALHVDATGVGYMSSNREGGMDHIYNIQLIDIIADFEITVVACDDEVASNVEMDLHNLTTGEKSKVRTGAEGKVTIRTVVGETAQLSFEGNDMFAGMGTKSYMSNEEGTFEDRVVLNYASGDNTLMVKFDGGKRVDSGIAVTMMKGGESTTMTTDANGKLTWPMAAEYELFRIDHPGYESLEGQLEMDQDCPKPDMRTVTLTRMVEIDLDLVLFNWDKDELKPEGKKVLNEVIAYMTEVTDVRVELSAHTDSHGSEEYNLDLSQRRAQSCVDYMVAGGIPAQRLVAAGYGEQQLKNRCVDGVYCTKDEHQENRRVELKILPN
ncbi:OmpA family protein [Flavobacteriales bacterium]|nr:OmpA family protein [Flavobacteriales bacterium]